MLTIAVNGIRRGFPVGGTPGMLLGSDCVHCKDNRDYYSQPVYLLVMCEAKDELVDNPIDAHGSADKLQRCVIGVVEDEVIQIEFA